MYHTIKEAILERIEAYQRIIITRHARPDGDAIGSSMGLWHILKASYPEKEIFLINSDTSQYMAFLGEEDAPIADAMYADALAIVLDTGNVERISNQKYHLAREIIKIDHHIDRAPYGDLSWVEEARASTCELVVELYAAFPQKLTMTREAATCLYTGMVTDSGRFQYESVSADTMRCAALLLEQGIDTQQIFARLYLKDYNYMKFKAHVLQKMKVTEHGVSYVFITQAVEDASACVSFMDSIRGNLIWLAFIENPDKTIRVRLRSRFVTVSELGEKYHGGGHACAAGATVADRQEMADLIADADALLKDYKETNEGWL